MATPKPKLKPKAKPQVKASSAPPVSEMKPSDTTQATPQPPEPSKPPEKESDFVEPASSPKEKRSDSTGYGVFGMGKMKELSEALKKAYQVQEGAKKLQAELDQMELEADSGDGSVKVVMNGSQKPLRVTIAPSAIDAGAQVLSDLVLEAWSSAYQESAATLRSRMEELTSGLNLPGM